LKGTRYAKRGVKAKTSRKAIRAAAHAAGVEPLDYMLAIMRDESADMDLRVRMAIAAAPFVHKKAKAEE
jgi:hypothetical protein